MLFRPSFCAHCGEKIERTQWGLLTSRRFCPVCESQFKGHELIPRVVVGIGVIALVLGLGAYLRSGPRTDSLVPRAPSSRPAAFADPRTDPAKPPVKIAETNSTPAANSNSVPTQTRQNGPSTSNARTPKSTEGSDSEQYYYCGARTKKGTPCSRRVKGNVRCYQHAGMPAMLPADQLRVK